MLPAIFLALFSIQGAVSAVVEVATTSQPSSMIDSSANESCNWFKYHTVFTRGEFSGVNNCLEQYYRFGHPVQKFSEACSIEPKDEFLSYEDSVWLFYMCIIRKTLGSRRLTLTSYAEIMAGNLTEATQSAILLNLKRNQRKHESTRDDGLYSPDFRKLQKYWKEYFDAEFEVCMDSPLNTCNKNETLRDLRPFWEPRQHNCRKRMVPDLNDRFFGNEPKFLECYKTFNETHSVTNWTSEIQSALVTWCIKVNDGTLEGENIDQLVNFEPLYNKYIAKAYYSKSAKRHIFNVFRNQFSHKFNRSLDSNESTIATSTTVKDVISYAVKQLAIQLRNDGHAERNVIFLTNAYILGELYESETIARIQLCYWFDTQSEELVMK